MVKVNWIFNGRQTAAEMQTAGYLLRVLPVASKLHAQDRISELFQSIHNQVANDLEYSCYPYEKLLESGGYEDETEVIYQRDLKAEFSICGVKAEQVELTKSAPAYENVLDIEIMNDGDSFDILVECATCFYKKESIERFCEIFKTIAGKLTDVLKNPDLTVSDIIGL